jgi:hypothetical protein
MIAIACKEGVVRGPRILCRGFYSSINSIKDVSVPVELE